VKGIAQHKLYKVLSVNAISVAVSLVLGILSTKIISIFIGRPGMALMGSFRNFSAMLKSLATLGINNAIIRLFVENKKNQEELTAIYATFFWIFFGLSALIGISAFLFAETISAFLFSNSEYVLPVEIFAITLPLIVMNAFWMAIYNGLEMFRKIIIIQIVSNTVVFAITALFVWNGNIYGGLISVAVSEVAMVAVTFAFVRKDKQYFIFRPKRIISKKHSAVIGKFSLMSLLSAVVVPLVLILIRNKIMAVHSTAEAGIWDGVTRLSGFYMIFFNTGLSLYYMPKLSGLQTDNEFKKELWFYFKTLVPLSVVSLGGIYLFRNLAIDLAFTKEFFAIKDILIWQLIGDFFKIMALAFGYQIVVKTMIKAYFVGEMLFNIAYLLLSFYFISAGAEGVLKAYCLSSVLSFLFVVFIFRKLLIAKA
jgi:PST family polysaccharide transporter